MSRVESFRAASKEVVQAEVVRIDPGDVIWITYNGILDISQAAEISKLANEFWPNNKIVIAHRTHITVVREDAQD